MSIMMMTVGDYNIVKTEITEDILSIDCTGRFYLVSGKTFGPIIITLYGSCDIRVRDTVGYRGIVVSGYKSWSL